MFQFETAGHLLQNCTSSSKKEVLCKLRKGRWIDVLFVFRYIINLNANGAQKPLSQKYPDSCLTILAADNKIDIKLTVTIPQIRI